MNIPPGVLALLIPFALTAQETRPSPAGYVVCLVERRRRFGEKRTTGARRMRDADWGELRVLRDLQKDVIGT